MQQAFSSDEDCFDYMPIDCGLSLCCFTAR